MLLSPQVSRKLTASLSTLLLTSSLVVSYIVSPQTAWATAACVAGTDYVETTDGADTVLVFSSTTGCDWTVPTGVSSIDLLLVGGGGGGGARVGAGGGGGAVVTHTSVNLASPSYTITVGGGGTGARFDVNGDNTFVLGAKGSDSTFGGGGVTLTAAGGGVGGSWDGAVHSQSPGAGGSGGGSGATTSAGVGSPGYDGGVAAADTAPHSTGGGGGAGSVGLNGSTTSATVASGGAGGTGISVDIVVRGTPVGYGGGGGGGVHGTWSGGTLDAGSNLTGGVGVDGGGNGGAPTTSASTVSGQDGTDGRGGGGGGAANSGDSQGSIGGDGGDGVVILRWLTVVPTTTPATPIWRATLDPNGGTCIDGTPRDIRWTSVFIGYRYLPGDTDCVRPGHTLTGWATTTDPATPITLPELVDPRDGERRAFLAANADLIAVWAENPTPIAAPAPITDLTVFANFLCGPCTTVWLIHSPTDDEVTVDITVGDEPTSCNTYAEESDLAFCELTPLTPGTLTITLTPRHGTVVGDPTRTVIALRD